MNDFINKIIGDLESKKEWKAVEARAKALPEEYRAVYDEIKSFVWSGGTGAMDPSGMFKELVDRFEQGVADGKRVTDITGDDVAAFVDSIVGDQKTTYVDQLQHKLNENVAKKLGK